MILSRMDLSFIFFIFAAFIVIPGTFFALAIFNKYLAAGIATIGMITLFILFGLQFFNSSGNYVQQTNPIRWPPSINMCPDYLTLYKHHTAAVAASGGRPAIPAYDTYYCVDTVGVSHGSNKLATFNSANFSACPLATKDLSVITSGVNASCQGLPLYLDKSDDERREFIVADCIKTKLTFEGIYDGTKTYNNVIPKMS